MNLLHRIEGIFSDDVLDSRTYFCNDKKDGMIKLWLLFLFALMQTVSSQAFEQTNSIQDPDALKVSMATARFLVDEKGPCTGTYVSENIMATAGHCFLDLSILSHKLLNEAEYKNLQKNNSSNHQFTLQETAGNTGGAGGHKVFFHPYSSLIQWQQADLTYKYLQLNDIALIRIDSESKHFVELSPRNTEKNDAVMAIGYRHIDKIWKFPYFWQSKIPTQLSLLVNWMDHCLIKAEIVIPGQAANWGDSGAGVFYKLDHEYKLTGIVSNIIKKQGDGKNKAQVLYQNLLLPETRKWIQSVIDENKLKRLTHLPQ